MTTKLLCYSCLIASHMITSCSSKLACFICGKSYHTLSHRKQEITRTRHPITRSSYIDNQLASPSESQLKFVGLSTTTVILKTAIIHMFDHCGVPRSIRVLIDSGSQVLVMTSKCVSCPYLPRQKCCM